jgi:hypothetical protein
MKRTIVLILSLMLVAGAIALPAQAKKKKKPAPVVTTLHFHGAQPLGELESDPVVNAVYLPMDATAPDGAQPRSKQITNGLVTPNTECAGNQLYPVWVGKVAGQVVGNVKVTLNTVSTPGGKVDVRIWPDVSSSLCTSDLAGTADYPMPAAEKTIDLPPGPGTTEIDLGTVNFKSIAGLMIQISPTPLADVGPQKALTPFFGRVLYDSADFDSTITFSCVPAKGASCAQ